MFKIGTKPYSIFKNRCPRCQEGKMFNYHAYNLSKIGKMNTHCNKCGLKYSREPGFFFGAAYVSYALTVAIGVAGFIATRVLLGASDWQVYFTVVAVLLILTFPYTFVLSRTIWINMFVNYDPTTKEIISEDN